VIRKRCEKCRYWKFSSENGDVRYGICPKIKYHLGFEIEPSPNSGYVHRVETESDFGCVYFKKEKNHANVPSTLAI
jgi:hypothetical protein